MQLLSFFLFSFMPGLGLSDLGLSGLGLSGQGLSGQGLSGLGLSRQGLNGTQGRGSLGPGVNQVNSATFIACELVVFVWAKGLPRIFFLVQVQKIPHTGDKASLDRCG